MIPSVSIVVRSFARSFYRENAGLFVFFMVITIGAVGQLNGAGLMDYHYSLIMGMLTNRFFFLLVLLMWAVYVRKCMAFVLERLQEPRYSFLYILRLSGRTSCFLLMLLVQLLLFAPVLVYASLVTGVALWHHWWGSAAVLIAFASTALLAPAALALRTLFNTEKNYGHWFGWLPGGRLRTWYPAILWRYIAYDMKMILAGIKFFTCCVLYLMARNNHPGDYDVQFPFLFFSFGLFAHGIIIYRVRNFEETALSVYRGFAVPLASRFLQYAFLYLLLFLPEAFTILSLAPVHLRPADALHFLLAGYSILLLLNSLSFADTFTMKDYLKLILAVYGVLYIFVATLFLPGVYLLFFPVSLLIFFGRYYRYQHVQPGLK